MNDEEPELWVHTESGIGTLRFNRPAKHNAISFDMWCGLAEAVDTFASDDAVRVIVLSGEGGRRSRAAPTYRNSKNSAPRPTPLRFTTRLSLRLAKN